MSFKTVKTFEFKVDNIYIVSRSPKIKFYPVMEFIFVKIINVWSIEKTNFLKVVIRLIVNAN